MIAVTTARRDTGEITRLAVVPELPPDTDEHQSITGHYPMADYYVIDGVPTLRAEVTATLDADTAAPGDTVTLSGLPQTCTVTVDGVSVAVDDGVLRLTVQTPGDYLVRLDEPPYRATAWRVTCLD